MEKVMIDANSDCRKSQRFTARRLTLLASVAAIGATVLLTGSASYWQSAAGAVPANAAEFGMQRPVGFADIVAKVKPAVISVRVKVSGAAEPALSHDESNDGEQQIPVQPGSPLDRFFRQFGDQFGHVRRSAMKPLLEKARASSSQQTATR
jgi:serine protease Do